MQVFKEEIEKTDQPGGPILDAQDVKAIFGGIPSIYDLSLIHISEPTRQAEISYAVFCLKKKKKKQKKK